MVEIVTRKASAVDLNELVLKFIPELIGKEIEKACEGIYPLQNVLIRKVTTLRAPKTDIQKLLEIHGGADAAAATAVGAPAGSADTGKAVDRPEDKKKAKEDASK